MAEIKLRSLQRPHYFNGQLLEEKDFRAEQAYHLNRVRDHARGLHTPGIVEGLDLERKDGSTILIRPGLAIDAAGREMVVDSVQALGLSITTPNSILHITLGYHEGFEHPEHPGEETEHHTRTTEFAVIRDSGAGLIPANDTAVVLGSVQLDGSGSIARIDTSVRKLAAARIGRGSVGATELAESGVMLRNLHPSIRSGWLRMSFKPSEFVPEGGKGQAAQPFQIGLGRTFCDERGATGTVTIPVPPGANRLKAFLIAGENNREKINIWMRISGWDPLNNRHVTNDVLKAEITNAPFHKAFPINQPIDVESHTVNLYVQATKDASISLIAAEFEWIPAQEGNAQ